MALRPRPISSITTEGTGLNSVYVVNSRETLWEKMEKGFYPKDGAISLASTKKKENFLKAMAIFSLSPLNFEVTWGPEVKHWGNKVKF